MYQATGIENKAREVKEGRLLSKIQRRFPWDPRGTVANTKVSRWVSIALWAAGIQIHSAWYKRWSSFLRSHEAATTTAGDKQTTHQLPATLLLSIMSECNDRDCP